MQKGNPRDGYFYPILKFMIDFYSVCVCVCVCVVVVVVVVVVAFVIVG